ncbi:hypothetical protein F0562_026855 [Nyssa sinensis]|uniref:Mechanosensitive ion channel protein n=1 Tax=Nyssa sinensis TaxID=561372 RepID=A0A5J5B476_9ASTE|nr:hypothetical protein F0562_026855 [Nyssa sinensis]
MAQSVDSADRREVLVKISGRDSSRETELASQSQATGGAERVNNIRRGSSYDFSKDATKVSKEFDFVTDSPLSQCSQGLSRIAESPTYGQLSPEDVRVSFNEATTDQVRRRSNASGGYGGSEDEVVLCSSNSSFQRKSILLKTKTKSRLMDPPEQDQRSQRMLKFGMSGNGSEIDEDDPLLDEDLPDEYKKMKFSKLTLLQLGSLILIITALVCSLSNSKFRRKTLFELQLWKWELVVLVLICGRLVSGWGIRIGVFFIQRNFLLRKRVLYFVYGLRNAVQNCIWLALVLIAWNFIFHKKVERMTGGKVLPYVTKIWVCLLVGTLVWLLKTLLVKVLASSFHVSTYFARIQESLFDQYIIETLSGLPLIEIQQEHKEEERVLAEVQKLQNAGATLPADLRATDFPRRGKLIGSGRHQKTPKAAKSPRFSRTMSMKKNEGITIDHLHRLNQKNISAWNMKRLMKIVRRGVLSTLDEHRHDSTGGEDEFSAQIRSECQAKAAGKKIFSNVAKPGSKYIYLEDLMHFMKDDEALKTMHLFEGSSGSKGVSKRILKNWMMVVEEMNILTTVFLRYDNQKIMYPNSVLATKPISNYYRSPDMGDAIDFCIHISTPMEKIATMKERITRYIENKSDHWYPAPMIVMRDVEDMNKLKWSVWLSHRMNHQDMGERWARRALLVEEMVKVLKELDIEYRMLPLDMNVRNMPALNSNRLPSNWTACAN